MILSGERLQDIWRNSELPSRHWREEIFDCDDFAFGQIHSLETSDAAYKLTVSTVYKSAVAKWGDEQFKADVRAHFISTSSASVISKSYAW